MQSNLGVFITKLIDKKEIKETIKMRLYSVHIPNTLYGFKSWTVIYINRITTADMRYFRKRLDKAMKNIITNYQIMRDFDKNK